jgi:SRSO17 transposase
LFTAPTFRVFVALVGGFVRCLGRHRVAGALRAGGPAVRRKHFVTYYRFFSRARWSLDEVGLHLLGMVMRLSPVQVELVLDDTLSRHKGKNIALAHR